MSYLFLTRLFCSRGRLGSLLPCMLIGLGTAAAQDTAARFQQLIAVDTDAAALGQFAATLQAGDLARLLPFAAFDPAVVADTGATRRRVPKAFFHFIQSSAAFRGEASARMVSQVAAGNDDDDASRTLLAGLVEYANGIPGPAEEPIFEALVIHRGIGAPSDLPVTLRGKIAATLERQRQLLEKEPAERFITAFAFALAQNRRLPGDPDSQWRAALLARLCNPATADALALGSPGLPALQQALLEADTAGEKPALTSAALLHHLEREVQLWSIEFHTWGPAPDDRVNFRVVRAFQAERDLYRSLANLQRFLGDGAYADYKAWFDLAGGWTDTDRQTDAPARGPLLSWVRDWNGAAKAASTLGKHMDEAVALSGYIRYTSRLFDLDWSKDQANQLGLANLTNVTRLQTLVHDGLTLAAAQGDAPDIDLGATGPAVPAAGDAPFLFPARDTSGRLLHSDHRQALRFVLAGYCQWSGDIAYRKLGPVALEANLPSQQTAPVTRYYDCASSLLGSSDASWTIGLGLFGRALEIERKQLLTEVALRNKYLDSAYDYMGNQKDWPNRFDDLTTTVEGTLNLLSALDAAADRTFDLERLKVEVQERQSVLAGKQNLRNAAQDLANAEQLTWQALDLEDQQQVIRQQIATLRAKEAEYKSTGAQAAVAAANQDAQAAQILAKADSFAKDIVNQQIAQLGSALDQLDGQLPDVQKQIKSAQDTLQNFEARAREAHRQKEEESSGFWGAFGGVLKSVASVVSKYLTGVDLVSVAESAINTVKAVESGDWSSAIGSGFDAFNTATDGKLKNLMTDGEKDAERYLSNLMSDSLGGAATSLQDKFQANGVSFPIEKATGLATQVVGQQAVRIGVSFLAQETNMTRITAEMGIGTSDEEKQRLHDELLPVVQQAREDARDAAYQALVKQGKEVLGAAASKLGLPDVVAAIQRDGTNISADVQKTLQDKLNSFLEADGQVEAKYVTLIQDIRANVKSADVTTLKVELLRRRDELVRHAADVAGADADKLEQALDKLLQANDDAAKVLPKAELPKDIRDGLTRFHNHVDTVRQKLAFLANPDAQQKTIDALADSGDQFDTELSKTTSELRDNVNQAADHFKAAAQDLDDLKKSRNDLSVKDQEDEFKKEVSDWRSQAALSNVDVQTALQNAAAESVLGSQQQTKVEDIGKQVTAARREAQRARADAAKATALAAQNDLDTARLELQAGNDSVSRWYAFNAELDPDQARAMFDSRVRLADRANRLLVQMWRLRAAYEFAPDTRPDYGFHDATYLDNLKKAIVLSSLQWQTEKVDTRQILSTCEDSRLVSPLGQQLLDRMSAGGLYQRLTSTPLTISAKDLPLLRTGYRFSIQLQDMTRLTNQAQIQDAANRLQFVNPRNHAPIEFPDFQGIFRFRVFGVGLSFKDGSILPGTPGARLNLGQESDGWVNTNAGGGKETGILLRLPGLEDPDLGYGVQLSPSSGLATGGLETRPLFGTWVLKIDDDSFRNVDKNKFEATVCFVGIGVPR